jgi:hypothetical protein
MDNWIDNVHHRAAVLHDQIAVALQVQRDQGVDMTQFIAGYRAMLNELYSESVPLAGLMDTSDLIFHAEGPAAQHHAAFSTTVAWLCEEVERRIKQLAMASLGLAGTEADAAERDLRILLNGMAPGSLWAGFSVDSATRMASGGGSGALPLIDANPAIETIRAVVRELPLVSQFIGDERVSEEINEAIADAEVRDASLMATFHLAPTGRRGIHTIEISSPKSSIPQAALTNRQRTVLRETAVRRPMLKATRTGTFIGQLREVDLDARRFQLRGVPSIGTLRCVLDDLNVDIARKHIGMGAEVTGTYETDRDGKPRLMRVESIQPFQIQGEIDVET